MYRAFQHLECNHQKYFMKSIYYETNHFENFSTFLLLPLVSESDILPQHSALNISEFQAEVRKFHFRHSIRKLKASQKRRIVVGLNEK
jgi:hypothetical protein